jgi:hypothetical protein
MRIRIAFIPRFALAYIWCSGKAVADDPARAAAELEKAVHLNPDLEEQPQRVSPVCGLP